MSSKSKKSKTAIDLSIRDVVYDIEANPLADHLKLGNKAMNLNNLRYFSLEPTVVKNLDLDENEENIIVNGKLSLPLNGRLKPKATDTLTDEKEAVTIVYAEIVKERRKAWELAQIAEKCMETLDQNLKIYEDKAKELGIAITVEDKKSGHVIADTDNDEIGEVYADRAGEVS